MLYPCPACGFEVFEETVGSYEICAVCAWEDDGVQLRYPAMRGGANGECLFEWQQKLIQEFPIEIKETQGFLRDKQWRPLEILESQAMTEDFPKTGFDYFQSIDKEISKYYWRK